ncbi:MAG TPA: S41 family peptidase [Stellaceae bacterium]|nr:S41 family peptidase [Stellaceae bacterium]
MAIDPVARHAPIPSDHMTSGTTIRRNRPAWMAVRLVLFLLTACSTGGDDTRGVSADPSGRLFTRTYGEISEFYLEPIPVETLAVAGLENLSTLDPSFTVSEIGRQLVISVDQTVVERLPAPALNDYAAWGKVTSEVLRIARRRSPELAGQTDEDLYRRVFDGILPKLDRFSRYAGADTARDQRAARDGFGGIGVTLDYADSKEARITSVLPNSPATAAGLRIDDRLTTIDGVSISSLTQGDVVKRLRGPIDTKVMLGILRTGNQAPLQVQITRSLIVTPTVLTQREDGVAILRITTFNQHTAGSVTDELLKARREMGSSLHGIVLDLRGNPGGLLDQAVLVTGDFLNSGTVVTTRGRHPQSDQTYDATDHDLSGGLPLVVLVNGGSASSSEIVAAALQDNGRAVIVGSTSYGKGTVQTVLGLPNEGELTLTWAKLFTPAGYLLHTHGVVPTFCTSGLSDDGKATMIAIDRGTHPRTPIELQSRATLSDAQWSDLRNSCPQQTKEPAADIKVAKRLLADPTLYRAALNAPAMVAARSAMHVNAAALR